MDYNWDINKINDQINTVKKLIQQEKHSIQEKEYMKMCLKDLKLLKKSCYQDVSCFLVNTPSIPFHRYIDKNHFLPYLNYKSYIDLPLEVRKLIFDSRKYLFDFSEVEDLDVDSFYISNDDLVNMSDNFYKSLNNGKYYQFFREFTNKNNHLLRFVSDTCSSINADILTTFYPRFVPYFTIQRTNTYTDFISINHEIAHGIFARYDHYKFAFTESDLLCELEGDFFDYLLAKYLKENGYEHAVRNIELDKLNSIYFSFCDFILYHYAIKSLKRNNNIDHVLVNQEILLDGFETILDKSSLIDSLQQSPKLNATYLISFLTSIELEEIYESDPEYAFYLLEKIRFNKEDTVVDNLRKNNIKFVDGDYQVLEKKLRI